MHVIEPFWGWRDEYVASEDDRSPFYGAKHDEFYFTKKVYNYFIHPQWDEFGSLTLYGKQIYTDYDQSAVIVELIGEWNDCLYNDILLLKNNLVNPLQNEGISKFMFICENVLNFHGSDDCYYEEWYDEVSDEGGWIAFINLNEHVFQEMEATGLQQYINFSPILNNVTWRKLRPQDVLKTMDQFLTKAQYLD